MTGLIFSNRRLNLLACVAMLPLLVPSYSAHSKTPSKELKAYCTKDYTESLEELNTVRLSLMKLDSDMYISLKPKFDYFKESHKNGVTIYRNREPYYEAYELHLLIDRIIAWCKSYRDHRDAKSLIANFSASNDKLTGEQATRIIYLQDSARYVHLDAVDLRSKVFNATSLLSEAGITVNFAELDNAVLVTKKYADDLRSFLSVVVCNFSE